MVIYDMFAGNTGSVGPMTYAKECIKLPNGLFLQYPELTGHVYTNYYSGQYGLREASFMRRTRSKLYGGLLTENVVQALARCIIAEQMLVIDERYQVVTMTHDEIVVIAPEAEADKCLDFMIDVMRTSPEWAEGLPLNAEGGYDVCYSK